MTQWALDVLYFDSLKGVMTTRINLSDDYVETHISKVLELQAEARQVTCENQIDFGSVNEFDYEWGQVWCLLLVSCF